MPEVAPPSPRTADAEAPLELKHGVLGFISSLIIGVSAVAPAYSLAAILGLLVATAGVQAPAVVIVSFVPMLLVATAYYWMNRADPDCGTTFAWATKALGPVAGWLAGWAILTAGVIVIGLLANTAATYTFTLVGWDAAAESKWGVIALASLIVLAATYVTVRGIDVSARTQYVLISLQLGGLILFALVALGRVVFGDGGPTSIDPELSWFSPFAIDSTTVLIAGLLLGVFAYWGWDAAVAVNEESADAEHGPGKAAVISTIVLLGLYLLVTVASLAWLGTEELGAFEDETAVSTIAEQIFASPLDKIVIIAVLTSAMASTQTTVLPSSRTLLSMGRVGAVPRVLATIHPKFQTPAIATWAVGGLALVFYVLFAGFVGSFYENSLLALGLLICLNYGLNALACVVYYRSQMLHSAKTALTMGVLPVLGFAIFGYVFVRSIYDYINSTEEDYTFWLGIAAPLLIGIGLMVLAIAIMAFLRSSSGREFFARKREKADSIPTEPAPPDPFAV